MIDGPPAWAVAIVFAGLLAVSWGEGDPGRGLAVFALGMLVALAAGTGLRGRAASPARGRRAAAALHGRAAAAAGGAAAAGALGVGWTPAS